MKMHKPKCRHRINLLEITLLWTHALSTIPQSSTQTAAICAAGAAAFWRRAWQRCGSQKAQNALDQGFLEATTTLHSSNVSCCTLTCLQITAGCPWCQKLVIQRVHLVLQPNKCFFLLFFKRDHLQKLLMSFRRHDISSPFTAFCASDTAKPIETQKKKKKKLGKILKVSTFLIRQSDRANHKVTSLLNVS